MISSPQKPAVENDTASEGRRAEEHAADCGNGTAQGFRGRCRGWMETADCRCVRAQITGGILTPCRDERWGRDPRRLARRADTLTALGIGEPRRVADDQHPWTDERARSNAAGKVGVPPPRNIRFR